MRLLYHKEYCFPHKPFQYVSQLYRYKNPKTNHPICASILIYGKIVVQAIQNGFHIVLMKPAYHQSPMIQLSFLIHYHQCHFEPYLNEQAFALKRNKYKNIFIFLHFCLLPMIQPQLHNDPYDYLSILSFPIIL